MSLLADVFLNIKNTRTGECHISFNANIHFRLTGKFCDISDYYHAIIEVVITYRRII